MIVEDELVVALDLRHRLNEMGYDVVAVVPSGEEAVEGVTAASPDLVLMDIKLSGEMDGVEAARRIQERLAVPIVFATAFADEATTRRVTAVAPHGYVVKPFKREGLRAVMETALARREMELRLEESERALRRAHEGEQTLRRRLEGIDRAGGAVSRALTTLGADVRPFLQVLVEEARALAEAELAALGVVAAPGRPFDPWVFSGASQEAARAIGAPPRAVGLLAEVIRTDATIRLRDLRAHPAFAGLPARHPGVTSFLGVPIHYRGESRGNLYLANKRGAEEFNDEDQACIEMLADHVGVALEIARLRQVEARERVHLAFVARAGATLAKSLDLDETLTSIADLIVPALADMCTIDLRDGGGRSARHVERAKQEALEAIHRTPELSTTQGAGGLVLADEDLARTVPEPQREVVRAVAARPLVVPMALGGQLLGVLRVATRLDQGDPAHLEEVAQVATLAIANARAHQAAKRSEREQRLLADLGSALTSSLDPSELLTSVARAVVRGFADACILDVVEDDGRVRRLEVAHADAAKASSCEALRRYPLDRTRAHLGGSALMTRRPSLVSEVSSAYLESVAQSEEHLRLLQDLEARSMMALPLTVGTRLLGCLIVISTAPSTTAPGRRYEPADLAFAEQAAHRIALAVENAELYQTARRAIGARDDVLGIVAHDLRNPLGVIGMQSELLLRCGDAPDGSRKPAEAIRRCALRMNRLIQDLLDVVRLEAGQQLPLERDRVSPRELVVEAAEDQRMVVAGSSLELSLEVTTDLPAIWGDRDRLLETFENLISNAIKFTPSGGRITVGASPREGEALFWVADTGAGVPASDVPHLFDRFWQAKQADRRGVGLGLSIVKGIVEAHGGRVWAESAPGQGSAFYFTIPLASRAQETASAACAARP